MTATARRALSAAVLTALAAGAGMGCDRDDPVNAQALLDVEQAARLRGTGDPERRYGELARGAAGAQAAEGTRAVAGDLAGDAAFESAGLVLVGPIEVGDGATTPGLLARQANAIVVAEQLNRLGDLVAIGLTLQESQRGARQGLGQVVERLQQTAADVRDAEQWRPEGAAEAAALPGVRSVEDQIAQVQSQIAEKEQQVAGLEGQRGQALSEASTQDQTARTATGRASIDAIRSFTDLRNQAAGLTADLDVANAELRRLREDLDRLQQLSTALQGVAEGLEQQARTVSESIEGSGGLQNRIDRVSQQIAAIVEGGGADGQDGPRAITTLAGVLSDDLDAAADLREQALASIAEAETSYQTAGQQADSAGRAAGAGPVAAAVRDSMAEAGVRSGLSLSAAQRERAAVHLGHALVQSSLLRLNSTGRAAQEAGRTVEPLQFPDAAAEFQQALSRAAAALKDARDTADNVIGRAQDQQRTAALAEKALALSQMIGVRDVLESAARLNTGAAEATVDLPTRDELRAALQEVADAAQQANVTLPPIPGMNRPAVAPPATPDDAADAPDAEAPAADEPAPDPEAAPTDAGGDDGLDVADDMGDAEVPDAGDDADPIEDLPEPEDPAADEPADPGADEGE